MERGAQFSRTEVALVVAVPVAWAVLLLFHPTGRRLFLRCSARSPVWGRERLWRYLSIDEARRFVADLLGVMTLAADPQRPYPAICLDPDDDFLVALARAAIVDSLVTGDRDLLELEDVGVPVITPPELVERLADAG